MEISKSNGGQDDELLLSVTAVSKRGVGGGALPSFTVMEVWCNDVLVSQHYSSHQNHIRSVDRVPLNLFYLPRSIGTERLPRCCS